MMHAAAEWRETQSRRESGQRLQGQAPLWMDSIVEIITLSPIEAAPDGRIRNVK